MSQILTKDRTDVTPSIDDVDGDYTGWFCVKTAPYPCPCGNFVADYMTCAHKIIVWPSIDDVNLLQMCAVARDAHRNPKVVEYKNDFGPCISFYEIKSNPAIIPHFNR